MATYRRLLSLQTSAVDHELLKLALAEALPGESVDLISCVDPYDALRSLQPSATPLPDLILMGWFFPGKISGLNFLRSLKADLDLRRIPVVVFVTSLLPLEIEAIYGEQALSVWERPMDWLTLVDVVHWIRDYWASDAQSPTRA